MAVIIICLFSLCKPKQSAVKTITPVAEKKDTSKIEVEPTKPVEPETAEYNIGFLMPFHLDENLQPPVNDLEEKEILLSSIPSLQFYEGAKMAVDSFKQEHLKINLKIFDSGDSAKLETMIRGIRIYNSDLLFVNTSSTNLTGIVKNAEHNKTALVYAQSASTRNQHLLTCLPNNQTMIIEMADYIARHYTKEKIIVVYRDVKKEKELGEWFAGRIDSSLANESSTTDKCTQLNYAIEKTEGLLKKLDKAKKNLIVIASSDEAFVSPLINTLAENSETYRLQVCGLPTWENFETVSEVSLEKLQTIIFTSSFINYGDAELLQFRKEFISKYSADPLLQAYQGFYLMKGFMTTMNSDNKNWKDFSKAEKNFNQSLFNFSKGNADNGFENSHISVLKFADYQLQLQPY
ncbi:MAG: hypothetical protein ABI723_13740 [Bacteroidia bacterium]